MLTSKEYISQLARGIEPALAFKEGMCFSDWQKEVHTKLEELLGLTLSECELAVEISGEQDYDHYSKIDFSFQSEPGYRVPCALFLSSFSINWLIGKLNVSKLAFVVSDKGLEISKFLVSHSHRGVTIIDSVGAYTMKGNKVLMCALKESEITYFQESILELDSNAFIIFSESQQIIGNGFRVYK